MNLKQFTNPKYVYDGYFETYFIRPFFHLYANFKEKESGKSCLLSLLAWIIVSLGISGIMMGQIGLIGPEVGVKSTIIVCSVWAILSIIPIIALIARTAKGAPQLELKPRMLGVDTLLGVSCLLFFVFGLLMMITTFDSETLNPNATYIPEADTTQIEEDYVVEEPIFTYQDKTPAPATAEKDTLDDIPEDPDLLPPDESFDPTIETDAAPYLDAAPSDSL